MILMEKSYSSNFSKFYLLTNNNIKIYFNFYTIELQIPTVQELFFQGMFLEFLNGLSNASDFWNSNGLFKATNEYGFIVGMYKYYKNSSFDKAFSYCFPNLEVVNNKIYCGEIEIAAEDLTIASKMLLVSNNLLSFDEFINGPEEEKDDDLAAFKKRQQELEGKIKNIKNKKTSNMKMEELVVFIMNAFPQFTLEKIMELNYFSFMYFTEWAYRIIVQRVQDIAAGNGLAKNYTTLFDEVKK